MAAPADVTIQNLNGTWVLNKSLSTDTDAILALQGIGWLTRKAISIATVTLSVNQFVEPNADDPNNAPITKVFIDQTATGGIKSSERRITDWRVREHKDRTFGRCAAQSRLIRGVKGADGKVRPAVELQTEPKEEKILKFMMGEMTVNGEEDPEGFLVDDIQEKDGVTYPEGEGLWLQSFVRSEEAPWTAEQIWGFEIINGQRYYTRHIAVSTQDGRYHLGRLVYDYQGQ
ncbi:hypothetical protein TMatcc_000108 [Talaromyces marneffei ATCC 18224]|uniref:Uncharacterized protein n=2 Tax=Talaromyces marneffei TaxID=37727 RepID=B6QQ10_TALMQ|nr:uncharacterized protein EYB26_005195 [Talaromyces marneffei]EEA20132.1 conserved hypothetical protein [Talaromyces marneffei ATCC 18224]KAE8549146.1 hypothetical protein EYB25_007661 [Talaromyces marneffei]QGA17524.1 hypothetical protein EYB26_005195 [Talaromyces marneffei]